MLVLPDSASGEEEEEEEEGEGEVEWRGQRCRAMSGEHNQLQEWATQRNHAGPTTRRVPARPRHDTPPARVRLQGRGRGRGRGEEEAGKVTRSAATGEKKERYGNT